ncbi:GspH/FimT family pseudopilin [Noviherbaspirillum sp.]|mgnify:CR=1 FL=1|uniref:GspH/FimT family pseudopilin n=1 Tax=Noviherbaspirillum sp. TaxID=1926288 RepID=UPI002FE25348
MLTAKQLKGFGLLELMIAIAIVSLAFVWGLPSFTQWIQGMENRTAAESIQNGLQLARTESVRRNAIVRFQLTGPVGRVAWTVGCVTVQDDCPAVIQSRSAGDGSSNARVGVSAVAIPNPPPVNQFAAVLAGGAGFTADTGVSFNGMGRVPTANVGTDITRFDITNDLSSKARRLIVVVGIGGQIRMCDPALVFAVNPQGCA